MSDEHHVTESLPAYALGSLDEAEARLVAEHLQGCYLCRAELKSFQQVAGQLALVAPDAIPSVDLKPRFMERIQSSNSIRVQPAHARRLTLAGGLISVVLIAALAFSNILLWQRLNHPEVITGPLGMRAVILQNTDKAPQASGFVIISADGGNGVLVVDELPPLDPQHEYQLWLVRDGQTTSGAVFSVDEGGYRGVRIESPETLLVYSAVSITIEPAGGSIAPIGEQVLGGSLFNP